MRETLKTALNPIRLYQKGRELLRECEDDENEPIPTGFERQMNRVTGIGCVLIAGAETLAYASIATLGAIYTTSIISNLLNQ